jgi:hypothetical protein
MIKAFHLGTDLLVEGKTKFNIKNKSKLIGFSIV